MLAIIERTLFDAESIAGRIYGRKQSLYGAYTPARVNYAAREMASLRAQIETEHFATICAFAEMHQDHVKRMINQIEERAKEKHERHQSAS